MKLTRCILLGALVLAHGGLSASERQFKPISDDYQLGVGYIENASLPMSNICVKDTDYKILSFQNDISLDINHSADKLERALNLDVHAKTGWKKFSFSSDLDYVRSIQSSDYSLSFSFTNLIKVKVKIGDTQHAGIDALNPVAATLYNQGVDYFIKRCGDSYIKGANLGGLLDLSLSFEFDDQQMKKKFEGAAKGAFGDLFSASGKLEDAINQHKLTGRLVIHALQKGGDPSKLAKIFGHSDKNPSVECGFNDLAKCREIINDFINYAKAQGDWEKDGFMNQFKIVDGKLVADSIEIIDADEINVGHYGDDFGLDINTIPASDEVIDARRKLNSLFDNNIDKLIRIQGIVRSKAFELLNGNLKDKLNKLFRDTQDNYTLFRELNTIDCFIPKSQNTCPALVSRLEKNMKEVDFSLLDRLRNAYYVNIDYNWPLLFLQNDQNSMDVYDLSLEPTGIKTNSLRINPASDYSYVSILGGYSYYNSAGQKVDYFLGLYHENSLVYAKPLASGYSGYPLWQTCVNGHCSDARHFMDIIPF